MYIPLRQFRPCHEAQLAELAHRQWTIWKTRKADTVWPYGAAAESSFPGFPCFCISFFAFRPDSVQPPLHSVHSVQARCREASSPVQDAGRADHVEDLSLGQPPAGRQGHCQCLDGGPGRRLASMASAVLHAAKNSGSGSTSGYIVRMRAWPLRSPSPGCTSFRSGTAFRQPSRRRM
jgi:hypothetical protein